MFLQCAWYFSLDLYVSVPEMALVQIMITQTLSVDYNKPNRRQEYSKRSMYDQKNLCICGKKLEKSYIFIITDIWRMSMLWTYDVSSAINWDSVAKFFMAHEKQCQLNTRLLVNIIKKFFSVKILSPNRTSLTKWFWQFMWLLNQFLASASKFPTFQHIYFTSNYQTSSSETHTMKKTFSHCTEFILKEYVSYLFQFKPKTTRGTCKFFSFFAIIKFISNFSPLH